MSTRDITECRDMIRNFRREIRQLLDKMNSGDPEEAEEFKSDADMKIDDLLDTHFRFQNFRREIHQLLDKRNSDDPDAELKHEANMKIDALLDTQRELLMLS
jgi:hypothetical protein